MKFLNLLILSLFFTYAAVAEAAPAPVKNAPFSKIVYFATSSGTSGGTGDLSGRSYGSAKALTDGDLLNIPAGMVVDKVYYVVDEAITGTSAVTVGDDDDADGFATSSATLGTPGIYGNSSALAGAYLQEGANKLPKSKYYSAAGKEVKVDFTGAATAGKLRVIIQGYQHVQ